MNNVDRVYSIINDFRWTHFVRDAENTDRKLAQRLVDDLADVFCKAKLYDDIMRNK